MGAAVSDKAFAAILKWSGKEEWEADRERVIADHLGPVCDALELTPDQIADVLGGAAFFQIMGGALEDFLGCDFEPDQRNVVDDYLKRRGWKESAPVRRYLKALRQAVIGIYEVTGTTPGSHLFVRDLVRGGAPIRIEDRLGSSSLVIWDRIAARLLPLGGKTYMSGAVLWLSFADARSLLERIAVVRTVFNREVGRELRRLGVPRAALGGLPVEGAVLSEAAPAITQAWLLTMLRRALQAPRPGLTNSDGEPLIVQETRFALADGARPADLEARLDELPEITRDSRQPVWTWLAALPPGRAAKPAATRGGDDDAPSGRILGIVRLEPDALRLETNSAERARRGAELLCQALPGLIEAPVLSPPPDDLAFALPVEPADQDELPLRAGDPDRSRQQVMDERYRAILGAPVPMLGGRSPKQAVRSKSGRARVVEWLKYLENQDAHRARAHDLPPYDFGWLWQALGVATERQ